MTRDWLFISIHFDTTYVYIEVSLFVRRHSDISYLTDSSRPIGPSCMRLPNVFLAVKMADLKSVTHSPKNSIVVFSLSQTPALLNLRSDDPLDIHA